MRHGLLWPVVCVAPRDAAIASPELATDLIEFCQSRIARFKCQRDVDFVD
jgi:hypothetical protein